MDIDVLKSLAAVAETGSFSRAATLLCISQSAVSKRIKLLEDNLNVQLLDRSGPVLKLTSAGRIVEKNAKAVIDICSRCATELSHLKGEKRIDFRCTPSYGISYMPCVTKALMEQRPDITNFSISFDNLEGVLDGVRSGECQLAVVEHCDLLPVGEEHALEYLNQDSLVLVGAPALDIPLSNTSIEDLLPYTLYIRSTGCCSRRILENKMERIGQSLSRFSKVLVCDDLNMILKSLLAGYGVGYMARSVVADSLSSGALQVYDLPGFEQVFQRSLLLGSSFVATDETNDLIRIIRSVAGSQLTVALGLLPSLLMDVVPL